MYDGDSMKLSFAGYYQPLCSLRPRRPRNPRKSRELDRFRGHGVIMGLVNAIVRPILKLTAMPLDRPHAALVINGLALWLASVIAVDLVPCQLPRRWLHGWVSGSRDR